MSNTISILLSAKDEASSTIGKLTGNITSGVENMAKSVQEGLTKASIALGAIGVGLTAYAKSSTDFTQDLVSNAKALQRQTGSSIEDSSKLLYVIQRMGGSADTAGSQFNIFAKQIQATRDQSESASLAQDTLRNKIQAAQLQVAALTEEQRRNGDSNGALKNKIDGLNLAIRGYQQNLTDATSPLGQLDIATQNADKSNRSFNDILLDVADKFKAMPDGVEKTNLALGLFGKSGDDMIKTLNLGRDGIIDLEKKAEELGLTLTDKTVGAITAYIASQKDLKDSTDGLKVQVGTLTAPVLTNFNKILTNMAGAALQADSPLRAVVANVAAFGGPVSTAAGGLIGFMANVFAINKGLGLFATITLGAVGAIVGGGGLIFALGSALGLDFGPFGKAVADAFGALVDWVNQSIKSLSNLGSSLEWQGLKSVAQDAFSTATGYVQGFTNALKDGTITNALKGIKDKFSDTVGNIAKGFSEILDSAKKGDWVSVGDKIGTALAGALNKAMDGLGGILEKGLRKLDSIDWVGAGIELGKNVPALLIGLIAGLLNFDVGKLLSGLWNHAGDILLAGLSLALAPAKLLGPIGKLLAKIPFVGSILKSLFDAAVSVSKGAGSALGKIASSIGKGFADSLGIETPKMFAAIGNFFSNIPAKISEFAAQAGRSALQFAEAIGGAIGDSIAPMVWKGEQFVSGLWRGMTNKFTEVTTWFGQVGGTVFNAIGDTTSTLWGKGSEFLAGLWNGSTAKFSEVLAWFGQVGGNVLSAIGDTGSTLWNKGWDLIAGLLSGLGGKFGDVTHWLGSVGSSALNAVGDLGGVLWNAGSAIITGFLRGIQNKFEEVKGYVGGIAKWIQDHKGPISYDRQLLVGAGQAMMEGLNEGLANGFKNVQSTVAGMNTSLSGSFDSPSLNTSSTGSRVSSSQTTVPTLRAASSAGHSLSVGQIVINNGGDYNRMLTDIGFQLELAS